MSPEPSPTYGMVNRITTKPGQRDALAEILLEAASRQREMTGCVLYVVHASLNDETELWVTEAWRSQEDHEASLRRPEVRALIEKGRPMIANIQPTVTRPLAR